jgi:homocysteine S-methyltransferase
MLKSVELAASARSQFLADQSTTASPRLTQKDVKIALSLGPFGATLSPAQEFDGFYPPPFGPQGLSPPGSELANRNAWKNNELSSGKQLHAVHELQEFHLERLRVFASDAATWDAIDILAFETVPVTWEIEGIRLAMAKLEVELSNTERSPKPWWIGMDFPDGVLPQKQLDGSALPVASIMHSALDDSQPNVPCPTGIAVNCTRSEFLADIVRDMEAALASTSPGTAGSAQKLWLVLYPNGGEVYDPATQTWSGKDASGSGADGWATGLAEMTKEILERGMWDGVIIGGCCKVGMEEIRSLAKVLSSQSV